MQQIEAQSHTLADKDATGRSSPHPDFPFLAQTHGHNDEKLALQYQTGLMIEEEGPGDRYQHFVVRNKIF